MTHTRTPWYIEHDPYPHIRSEDHGCILARDCLKPSDEEFIVKACNNHKALIHRLEVAKACLETAANLCRQMKVLFPEESCIQDIEYDLVKAKATQ